MTLARSLRAALAALALAAAATAAARPRPTPMPTRLATNGGRLLATLDLSAAFPAPLERELGNGLTNVIAVYVAVLPTGGDSPALVYGRVIEILFDVWDEAYAVTVKDPRTPQGVQVVLADFEALRAFLSKGKELDLGPVSLLPAGTFTLEARVEINPVSKEQLHRTREFIANPAGGPRGGGSRSILGAVASFLLREPEPGSDVHLFRSRPFGRGEVAAR